MTSNDLPECVCPLIDVSTYGRHGIEVAFVLGNPRGTGCPIHETQAMRDEIRDAVDIARYGFLRHAAVTIEQAEDYPHIPMRPDPWLKPRPTPVDTSWITLEPVANYGWRFVIGVLGAVALVALIIITAIVAGG